MNARKIRDCTADDFNHAAKYSFYQEEMSRRHSRVMRFAPDSTFALQRFNFFPTGTFAAAIFMLYCYDKNTQ
jgi:hypothetical protein